MKRRVIIIGGGIAGLTTAVGLKDCEVTLLEAKDRLGGRIQTSQRDGSVVELGAEFVHGQSKALLETIHAAGEKVIPASERNQLFDTGELTDVDVWKDFGELMEAVDPRERDDSFAEFLNRRNPDDQTRRMMLAFVGGFNAADPKHISVHSLLRANYAAEQMGGDKQSFLACGYGSLVDFTAKKAAELGVSLLTNTEVRTIRWQKGEVIVEALCEGVLKEFLGDAAIVTVPLGVLKARAVRFEPSLPEKEEAINGMEFGNVVKISLVFGNAWWPDPNFGFIHTLNESLQTWWSNPWRPVLTGWSGGIRAEPILNHSPDQLQQLSIEILSRLFSVASERIRAELVSSHTYNWTHDPHIRGAYSYIPVNGLFLPKQLGAPVDNTLFFAGEATARDAQMGTVFAALESGHRVAREIMEVG